MPELRKDPVNGRWVIIASERSRRPSDFDAPPENGAKAGFCPLCVGNEQHTPGELMAYRDQGEPNSAGWSVRVVPNKYPALCDGDLEKRGLGLYDMMTGVGAHEVIIETPNHGEQFADFSEKQIENVLWAYRDRMLELRKDPRLRYVLIFKNHGKAAGASLQHSHSQLIGLPIIPKNVAEELRGAKEYFSYKERCVFCDIIHQDLNDKVRLVAENPDFIAVSPFAGRFPFEIWLLPKKHDSCFEDAQKHEFVFLAKIFKEALARLNGALGPQPYNFILHTSPWSERTNPYYHWHFEITTRLTKVAGFERGSGFYINPTAPEQAAQFLREVKI
jgi:UDPglucose--hexose-1-phosphate uridylyltransferase